MTAAIERGLIEGKNVCAFQSACPRWSDVVGTEGACPRGDGVWLMSRARLGLFAFVRVLPPPPALGEPSRGEGVCEGTERALGACGGGVDRALTSSSSASSCSSTARGCSVVAVRCMTACRLLPAGACAWGVGLFCSCIDSVALGELPWRLTALDGIALASSTSTEPALVTLAFARVRWTVIALAGVPSAGVASTGVALLADGLAGVSFADVALVGVALAALALAVVALTGVA